MLSSGSPTKNNFDTAASILAGQPPSPPPPVLPPPTPETAEEPGSESHYKYLVQQQRVAVDN